MMGLMGSSLNPTSTIDRRLLLNVARYLENKHIQAAWLRPEHTVMEKVLVLWHVLGMPLCQGCCMDPI